MMTAIAHFGRSTGPPLPKHPAPVRETQAVDDQSSEKKASNERALDVREVPVPDVSGLDERPARAEEGSAAFALDEPSD